MIKLKIKDVISYFFMLPSIFIGILAMISYGVPTIIWIQNIIIWLLGTIFGCVYLIRNKRKQLSNMNLSLTFFIIVFLLVLPFWFNGLDGVHRWISFGFIKINVASVFLPLLIIHLWKLSKNNNVLFIGLTYFALILMLFQPDAGQVTAFASAIAIILWNKINSKMLRLLNLTLLAILVIISWLFLDDLEPVPYVEQIILLVADMGIVWLFLGVISLLLLIFSFYYYVKKTTIISISLGVYFLMTMIVTSFGNFPMPIMGYGTSPILGYLIAITWLINRNR